VADRAGIPDVTIVVVSFNTREVLECCLEAVFAGSPGLAREVIVVDNASSDGSPESVARRWPEVRLVVNRENRGYAPACNQMLRAACGRTLLALNSDALPRGDALAAPVRHLDEHSELAAGPRLLNADGSTPWVCARRRGRVRHLLALGGSCLAMLARPGDGPGKAGAS